MADPTTEEIIKQSVTANDVGDVSRAGGGLVNFILPIMNSPYRVSALPPDLPPYWSIQRDAVLRATTILEKSFWAGAVAIAATKAASQSFDFKGDAPSSRLARAQSLMLEWSGRGYVPSQMLGVQDYTCTDNGEFHEVVRSSAASGSKIIGLVHLDSMRCLRTGDPAIPVIFRDLHGALHEMKDYQVIDLVDMPDPGLSYLGVGHCAAERAYDEIYKWAGITRTKNEKITGAGAHQLAFIKGATDKNMRDAIATGEQMKIAKGLTYYMGTIMLAQQGDEPLDLKTLQLRGLPENFDPQVELNQALLAYANALGLILTDLQPLSGQGLGTGKQAETLEEKSAGRGMAARRKQLTHLLNMWVMPDQVTFYFAEKDYRDEKNSAEVAAMREETRSSMILSGEITPQEGRALAIESDDLPKSFVTAQSQDISGQTLSDEEKPEELVEDDELPADNTAAPIEPTDQTMIKEITRKRAALSRLYAAVTDARAVIAESVA